MEKQLEKPQETTQSHNYTVDAQKRGQQRGMRGMWWAIIAAAVTLFIGVGIGLSGRWMYMMRSGFLTAPVVSGYEGYGRGMMHHGTMLNPTDGTAYTRLSGVVTQVSGATFTIAGSGTTKTITTNANTTYNNASGGNKVSVNDTVSVVGTDSNGTFTATTVTVLNR